MPPVDAHQRIATAYPNPPGNAGEGRVGLASEVRRPRPTCRSAGRPAAKHNPIGPILAAANSSRIPPFSPFWCFLCSRLTEPSSQCGPHWSSSRYCSQPSAASRCCTRSPSFIAASFRQRPPATQATLNSHHGLTQSPNRLRLPRHQPRNPQPSQNQSSTTSTASPLR